MHESDLEKTLVWLREQLDSAEIPFAVIGAWAMRVNGFVRHTEDLDIITTREGLDRIHERLVGLGIVPRARGLRKRLKNTLYRVDIDVIQAGENAGSSASPIPFPDPSDGSAWQTKDGIRYATLATLLTLKVASGEWGRRLKDFADVIALIRANGLDESYAEQLPVPVRSRFRDLVERCRQEIDLTDE